MSTLEIIAVAFGLACVWLTCWQNIWCWPTGLVMCVLYIFIFYEAKLYSDVGLQVVNVFLGFYGWYHWLHGGRERLSLPVTRIACREAVAWAVVAVAGTAALGWFTDEYLGAALAYWDAAIAVLSLIAQYLLARKVLESWLIWIVVDVLAVGVYAAKDLHLSAGLYFVFLCLATMGFFAWKRTLAAPAAA